MTEDCTCPPGYGSHLYDCPVLSADPFPDEAHLPRRGSDVEAYLKAARDRLNPVWGDAERRAWHVLDDLLDDYRLRADTGSLLSTPREEMGPN